MIDMIPTAVLWILVCTCRSCVRIDGSSSSTSGLFVDHYRKSRMFCDCIEPVVEDHPHKMVLSQLHRIFWSTVTTTYAVVSPICEDWN